jgi:hypothetical protein
LSPDPDSPAHSKTYFTVLLSLFRRSDEIPIKTEIARTVAAIFRVLAQKRESLPRAEMKEILTRIFALHPEVGLPIIGMVTQTEWPVVRSEGWFCLALIARTREGHAVILEILKQQKVVQALTMNILGDDKISDTEGGHGEQMQIDESQSTPPAAAATNPIDRSNTMVFVNEVLKNHVSRPHYANLKPILSTILISYRVINYEAPLKRFSKIYFRERLIEIYQHLRLHCCWESSAILLRRDTIAVPRMRYATTK